MAKRKSGYIVNISSIAGFIGAYGYSAYGASKYAVRGFSDVIRAELKPYGIGVSVVFPPDTDTPQFEFENKHKPEITRIIDGNAGLLSADDVAKEIIQGIEKKKYIIIPGAQGKVLYLLSGIFGRLIYPIMDFIISQARTTLKKKNVKR
jgi:3-dehydrosphinganine reductase